MTAHPIHRRSRQRGFTLIELLVTMTVMIVMLGIGIPAFKNFTATQRVKAVAVDVATALLLARSEAVKRNKTVTIAPLTAGDWTSGWTVKDTAMVLDQKNALNGLAITGPATISYQGNGRVTAAASFDLASTVTGDARRCVKVDLSGVPSTTSGACS
jgi:type IV fimbrial biogenesis protein FimT